MMPIKFIQTDDELISLCDKAGGFTEVFVDTEFRLQTTYMPEPSLLQLMANDQIYLIDVLSASSQSLSLLAEIFTGNHITKILHSASQDIEVIYQLIDAGEIRPIFDTQVAAAFAGMGDSLGYGKLVEMILHKKIDKDLQFSDWIKRPLLKKQLEYAALDVLYLPPIYEYLKQILEEKGFYQWFVQDMSMLYQKNNLKSSPLRIIERMRLHFNSQQKILLLAKLVLWREELAIKHNMNRNSILNDDVIIYFCGKYKGDVKALLPNLDELTYAQIDKVIKDDSAEAEKLATMVHRIKDCPERDKNKAMLIALIAETELEYKIDKNVLVKPSDLRFLSVFLDDKELVKDSIFASGWRFEIFGKKFIV